MDNVAVEDRGAVRTLTANRPEKRNCSDGATAQGSERPLQAFCADDRMRVSIVRAAGDLVLGGLNNTWGADPTEEGA